MLPFRNPELDFIECFDRRSDAGKQAKDG